MNKERFHNALAMALGYEQILKAKRYNIIVVDNADEPQIDIKDADGCVLLSFKASGTEVLKPDGCDMNIGLATDKEIRMIVDAVHQAYFKATTNLF